MNSTGDTPNDAGGEQPDSGPQQAMPGTGLGGDGAALERGVEGKLWVGRTHWKHYFGRVLLVALGLVLIWIILGVIASRTAMTSATAFWIGLIVALVVGAITCGWLLLTILSRRYELTSQRLFIDRGVLSITRDQTELIRVDDVRVRKTLMDRVFGLGSVEVLSTDASDRSLVITGVKDADTIAEHVRTHMRALRSRSLFVEKL